MDALKELKVVIGADMRNYDAGLASMAAKEASAAQKVEAARRANSRQSKTAELAAVSEVGIAKLRLSGQHWAAERAAAQEDYRRKMMELNSLAAQGQVVDNRKQLAANELAVRYQQISQQRLAAEKRIADEQTASSAKHAAEVQKTASLERNAAMQTRQYELQLLNSKWAAERAAAHATYAAERSDILSNAATEGAVKNRLRLADLKHEAELHAIQQRRIKEAGEGMTRAGSKLTMGVTMPGLFAGGASAKMAMEYGDTMAKIVGLTGTAASEVEKLSGAAKKLAAETGKSPQELANALYFIASSGFKGAQAVDVLTASARASAAGLGDTAVVADAVTSAVNAYGAANLSAGYATDIMVAAVREGKAEPQELAQSIGRVLPVAAQMGISFDNVAASIAVMSRSGLDADEAATALRGTLNSLLDPAKQTKDALASVGLTSEGIRQELATNLIGGLKHLREAFKGNDEALGQIFPNIRALTGVLNLTGQDASEVAGVFQRVQQSTGDTNKAFEVMSKTVGFQTRQAFSGLMAAAIELGNALTPVIKAISKEVKDFSKWFTNLSPQAKDTAVKFGLFAIAAGPVLTVLGNMVLVGPKVVGMVTGLSGAIVTATKVTWAMTTALRVGGVGAMGELALAATPAIKTLAGFAGIVGAATIACEAMDATVGRLLRSLTGIEGINLSPIRAISEGIKTYQETKSAKANKAKSDAFTKEAAEYIKKGAHSKRKEWEGSGASTGASAPSSTMPASPMVKTLSDDAKKAIAENDTANELARQEMVTLGESNKYQQERLKAWFELKNETAQTVKMQKEALAEHGVSLDVTDQIKGLKQKHAAALAKINEEEKKATEQERETLRDAEFGDKFAKLSLMALRSKDEFQSQRLQINANFVQTMRQLEKSKASQLEVALTIEQANKQLADVDKREAEDQAKNAKELAQKQRDIAEQALAERSAGLESQAMRADAAGDTVGAAHIRGLAVLTAEHAKLNELRAKGIDTTNQSNLAQDNYNKTIGDAQLQFAQNLQSRLKEYKDQELKTWEDRINAARRYVDFVQSKLGIMSLDSIRENIVNSSAKASFRAPQFMPPPPSQATPDDVRGVMGRMQSEKSQSNGELVQLLSDIRNILGNMQYEGGYAQ